MSVSPKMYFQQISDFVALNPLFFCRNPVFEKCLSLCPFFDSLIGNLWGTLLLHMKPQKKMNKQLLKPLFFSGIWVWGALGLNIIGPFRAPLWRPKICLAFWFSVLFFSGCFVSFRCCCWLVVVNFLLLICGCWFVVIVVVAVAHPTLVFLFWLFCFCFCLFVFLFDVRWPPPMSVSLQFQRCSPLLSQNPFFQNPYFWYVFFSFSLLFLLLLFVLIFFLFFFFLRFFFIFVLFFVFFLFFFLSLSFSSLIFSLALILCQSHMKQFFLVLFNLYFFFWLLLFDIWFVLCLALLVIVLKIKFEFLVVVVVDFCFFFRHLTWP